MSGIQTQQPQTQYSGLVYKYIDPEKPSDPPMYYLVTTEQTPGGALNEECIFGCYSLINLDNGNIERVSRDTLLATQYWDSTKPKWFHRVEGEEAINKLNQFINSKFNTTSGNIYGSSKIINQTDMTTDGKICSKKNFKIKTADFPACNKNYIAPAAGGRKTRRKKRKSIRKRGKKSRK
jgi:hypothetical protein